MSDGRRFDVDAVTSRAPGALRWAEVYDARDRPHRTYLGSLTVSPECHAALVADLGAAATVRALHGPCHYPGDMPAERCRVAHVLERKPRCVECSKPWPCPTVEVLTR